MGVVNRTVGLGLLLVVALAAAGCHRRDRTIVDDRRLQNLQRTAARDLGCPAVSVEVQRLDERLFRASGCNGWRDYAIVANGPHRYGGARWQNVIPLAERASVELMCPPDGIGYEGRSPRLYAVAGCGRATQLELRCGPVDCGWVLASPVQTTVVQAVAPAPSVVVQPAVEATPVQATPAQPPPGYGATVTVTVQ